MTSALIDQETTEKAPGYPDFTPAEWEEIGRSLDESMEDYYKGNYYTRAEMDKHLAERRARWQKTIP